MSDDMEPEGCNGIPCPFCASPPFVSFTLFCSHFNTTHLSDYKFVGSHSEWGFMEATCVVNLANLINEYCPVQKRTLNKSIASLVRCDPATIVKFRKIKMYLSCQDSINNGDNLISSSLGNFDSSGNTRNLTCDNSLTTSIQDLTEEVFGISALLKDQCDSRAPIHINSVKSTPERVLYTCLFCDRSFPSKIGLGQHKRHAHPDEYALEVEHRYSEQKHVRWDDEEIRMLIGLEKEIFRDSPSFKINKELEKLIPHRTYSQIKEFRKSARYKTMKEDYVFASANHGLSPPSPAVLLSPVVDNNLAIPLKAKKRADTYLDSPTYSTNIVSSFADQSPCSFDRPVRPLNLGTIAEEEDPIIMIDSPVRPTRDEMEALPLVNANSQELACSRLDVAASLSTTAPSTGETTSADPSPRSDDVSSLKDPDALPLYVQLPDCDYSTPGTSEKLSCLPDMTVPEDLRTVSSNACADELFEPSASTQDIHDIDLDTFNYCVNLPRVPGKTAFDYGQPPYKLRR